MDKSKAVGGLNWGNGHVAIYLTVIIIIFVVYMMKNRKEISREKEIL
jgi:uncharacterized membrane-anchored protein